MIGRILLAAMLFFGLAVPAGAQFADQATYAGTGGGIANAQAITLSNAASYADLLGVLVKYVPGVGNTAAATLAVTGNNGLLAGGPISFRRPTGAGLSALAGGELVAGQPVWIMYDGTFFDILSVTSTTVTASNLANSALSAMGLPTNMQLNAAVSANQLTVSLCAMNPGSNTCNNPSATSPVLISFRDVTAANGDPAIISQQAALSLTALSTSNFGCITATTCRLWVIGINNGGTLALCLFNALLGTTVAPINEAANQTSQSGTTGGTSAQLYYCSTSAVTGKAIRILGYVEATWVSGTGWSTTPSLVQVFGPGIKKPGDVVQRVAPTPTTTQTTLGTSLTQTGISGSITPTSAANIIDVSSNVNALGGAGANGQLQFSRGTGPTVFGEAASFSCAAQTCPVPVHGIDVPSSTSALTYYVYGKSSATNIIVNDAAATYQPSSSIVIQEIMSSLEPANDDQPLRMVG